METTLIIIVSIWIAFMTILFSIKNIKIKNINSISMLILAIAFGVLSILLLVSTPVIFLALLVLGVELTFYKVIVLSLLLTCVLIIVQPKNKETTEI